MSDQRADTKKRGIEIEYEFSEPPHKVWRAISIPEFCERWLPRESLADPEPLSVTPDQEIRYRMRENVPQFLESTVTFQIAPNAAGGTSLRIIHELTDMSFGWMTTGAANTNGPDLTLAA